MKEFLNPIGFTCDDNILTEAYKIALDDVKSNIKLYKDGLLTNDVFCILAGGGETDGYDTPWTRDTAINTYNALALLDREVAWNTLFSVLEKKGEDYFIDGQYWDAIIWAIGAYRYYTVTGDREFLQVAQNAISNSLARYEKYEFDPEDNLFRGPAVYGDGIAAYPDKYSEGGGSSCILVWPHANKEKKHPVGYGIPMKALSTNCVYHQAYKILAKMNESLGLDATDALAKAEALKIAINKVFWNEENGTYDYLAYECDYQEALGVAFVLLFDIADDRQTELVLKNTYVTKQGIACVWPSFERYLKLGGYGRHSGCIWPHAQGFWASACAAKGYTEGFESEMYALASKAVTNGQFHEVYHPDSGEIYGGLQGSGQNNIGLSRSVEHQNWSATGYLSLIYYHILGATIEEGSVTFAPTLPSGVNQATVNGFVVGNTTFEITITRGKADAAKATYTTTEKKTVSVCLSVE